MTASGTVANCPAANNPAAGKSVACCPVTGPGGKAAGGPVANDAGPASPAACSKANGCPAADYMAETAETAGQAAAWII